jgi:hypothetical protein
VAIGVPRPDIDGIKPPFGHEELVNATDCANQPVRDRAREYRRYFARDTNNWLLDPGPNMVAVRSISNYRPVLNIFGSQNTDMNTIRSYHHNARYSERVD